MYRLVVIDDEYIVVQGIKALLSRLKLEYEVVGAAYDGIQGLEVIRSEKPDVVITDIRIPGLDGLSLIEAAKEECPETYFIVISGYLEFVYAQRALTLGVSDYIDKPVTAEKLKNALLRIENQWAKTRKDDNQKAQANRKKYVEMEKILDGGVKAITIGDSGLFRDYARKDITGLKELYPEMEDFRREFYKHLCVLSDILIESQKQVERSSLVSFQEMEKCDTIEKVQEYGENVLSDIEKHLTEILQGNNVKRTVKLFRDYRKFETRVKEMAASESAGDEKRKNEKAVDVLKAIAL